MKDKHVILQDLSLSFPKLLNVLPMTTSKMTSQSIAGKMLIGASVVLGLLYCAQMGYQLGQWLRLIE